MTKANRKYYLFFLLLALFNFCIASSQLYNYLDFKPFLQTEKIEYNIKEKKMYKSGSRRSYKILINYNNKDYSVNITGKVYNAMDKGYIPFLYHVEERDIVISPWSVQRSARIAWVFYGMTIMLLLVSYFKYGRVR